MKQAELKDFLERKTRQYNKPGFIDSDPINIPRQFSQKEDIEISGFLTATIAWGQRVTIIKNARQLMTLMDHAPHDFILNFEDSDLAAMKGFVHRTFNFDDLMLFLCSLQNIYRNHQGLESAFKAKETGEAKEAIGTFRKLFFEVPHLKRSEKHVSNPNKNSSCKRLNMFLRWMVRKDNAGVDFGIWHQINPAKLSCPLDVHSGRVARKLGLLQRKANDWRAVAELDGNLRKLDPKDPVKYDYALFGLGVFENF